MDWIKFLRNSFRIELEIPFRFFQGYSTDVNEDVIFFSSTEHLKQIQRVIFISSNANQREMGDMVFVWSHEKWKQSIVLFLCYPLLKVFFSNGGSLPQYIMIKFDYEKKLNAT